MLLAMRYIQFKKASASSLHPQVSVCGPLFHSKSDSAFILWSELGFTIHSNEIQVCICNPSALAEHFQT